MKIGIDVRLWNQTGVGRYIRNLVENLEEIDKNNAYVLFARDEDNVSIKNSNFKTVKANIKWHSVFEQLQFVKLISKEGLDLMHFTYPSVPVFYKKSFIVTIHDLIPLHFQTGEASTLPFPFYKFKFLAYKLIVSQAAKNAKKIITPSIVTKQDIEKYLKVHHSKIKVIYEGVDSKLKSQVRAEKENMILYVGNAYPHKNIEVLIEAFKGSKINKLILVGQKDYFYNRLEQKIKKMKLGDKIIFYGFAREDELSSFYRKAKALIVPSFMEGFGLPGLEAMANGCLVIASNIPVLRETYGNAAIYFNPKDPNDLSKKLDELEDNDSKDKIKQGFERVNKFSWKKSAQETLRLYESCASASSA